MFPKFQKASDKLRMLVQNRANFSAFRSHTSMARKSSKVQALYELCQNMFTPSGSPPPSSAAINKLCSVLDTMSPADVGLKEENLDDDRGHGFFGLEQLNRVARWAQPITYLDIYECDSFTMCIFCFPTSSVIPLHDHPGMTVFSKVLYGSLHVRAYDWVEPAQESKGPNYFPVRLAKLAVDKVLTAPCGTSVLYPRNGGNLHYFTAVTPCAVLDILTPPYREDAGRKCTYYRDYPYTAFATGNGIKIEDGKEEEYAWLVETEPDNLYMRPGNYTGPTIQV
ncbi:PREDICTED: plant cysteine [Prunus dulcis]|uniref:cysteine dioxygenase n=1 Tax=Prunus dulcis TaxID=3755 RepID=A0A5E4F2R5_PRUDU|nr:plant cysteine oxidase 3 [Prunus dulcis]VVA21379.1 PREDICTED: plant cysteine [Prunus dulcis]